MQLYPDFSEVPTSSLLHSWRAWNQLLGFGDVLRGKGQRLASSTISEGTALSHKRDTFSEGLDGKTLT